MEKDRTILLRCGRLSLSGGEIHVTRSWKLVGSAPSQSPPCLPYVCCMEVTRTRNTHMVQDTPSSLLSVCQPGSAIVPS